MTRDRPTDRRVQRTRRALSETLVTLMIERGWDEISVQDICERADIGRSTFYMHFSGKERLLISSFDDLRREIRGRETRAGERTNAPLGFAHGLIEHVHENQRAFRAVTAKRSGYVVQRRFRELVIGMVEEDLASLVPPGWQRDATVHWVAGAFVELLTWWLQSRQARRPDEVEALLHRLTAPVVAQLRARK